MGKIAKKIKRKGKIGLRIYLLSLRIYHIFNYIIRSDKESINRKFLKVFGYKPDLKNPKTMNEKLQWLKLNDRKDFYTICADKYAVRKYIGDTFGNDLLIPLIYHTTNWKNISSSNIIEYPCIIKSNHDSGGTKIIRDPKCTDWNELRIYCKHWLRQNYYHVSRQWQYKNIKPRQIIVEKLLESKSGKIPNDYKLHYINGELQFIYVSFDREGINDRCIYDINWNRLSFMWIEKENYRKNMNTSLVPKPLTFDRMVEIGDKIANEYKYIRVDFYDVDGKLFFGEITHHHGGGFDMFFPEAFDLQFGEKLNLE